MRCPVLIGRESERSTLATVIGAARAGRGGGAVVVGEAGIGKTRLVHEVQAMARRAGMAMLVGRADPASRAPLGPIAEALLAGTRGLAIPDDDDLKPYVPLLATFLPHWRPPGWEPPSEMEVVLAEAVLRLLRRLATPGGLVLILEDLHWADATTLAVAMYLTEHVTEARIALVATVREGEPGSTGAAALERGGAQLVSLGRLSDEYVEAMIAACMENLVPPDVVTRVTRDAAGLPLLVEDLLVAGAGEGAPRRFADTVEWRLSQLPETERHIVAMAAILGSSATAGLLAAATSTPAAIVTDAVRHAVALQLVTCDMDDRVHFRHALTRDVVIAQLAATDAARMRRAAAAVVASWDALGRVERGLMAATLLSDAGAGASDEAANAQLTAGRAALDAGEIGRAIPALRQAVADAVDDSLNVDATLALAGALLDQGDAAGANDVALPLAARVAGRDPGMSRAVWLLTARAATEAGRWEDAEAALRYLSVTDDTAVAAEVATLEARIALGAGHGESRVEAEHLAHRAAALASEAGRADLQCEALEIAGLAARSRDLDRAAQLLSDALDLAAQAGGGRRRLHVLNELAAVEMLRDARPDRLRLTIIEARRVGAVGTAVGAELNLSSLLVMTGRFDEAVALALSVAETAQRLGLVPVEAAAHLMIGFAAAHQGLRAQAEAALAAAEARAPDDPDLHAGAWAIGRGFLALLEEDRPAARRAFQRARQESPDVYARILNPHEGPHLFVRAVDGEADLETVEAIAQRGVRSARWSELWVGSARAVALGARGEPDRARAASTAAHALRRGEPYPVFHALAARLLAETAFRDGWGDPVSMLQPAEATLDMVGARRAASACRALLKQAGRPAPRRRAVDHELTDRLRVAGVTAREAEVLDLLADRLTNRELAGRLYLSPRTVEKHVASLLVKLDAADRTTLAELGRSLRR